MDETKLPDISPADFDKEDREIIRELIKEYRHKKAVREFAWTMGKYMIGASAVLVALTQIRGWLRDWLQWIQTK